MGGMWGTGGMTGRQWGTRRDRWGPGGGTLSNTTLPCMHVTLITALTRASDRFALKTSSESVLRTLKVVAGGLSEIRSGPVCCWKSSSRYTSTEK